MSGSPDTRTGGEGINSGLGHLGTTGSTGNSYGGSGQEDTRSTSSTAGAPNNQAGQQQGGSGDQLDPEFGVTTKPDTGYGRHSEGAESGDANGNDQNRGATGGGTSNPAQGSGGQGGGSGGSGGGGGGGGSR